jgi:tRNA nucleotidyltransferase/poly(A) polymerase
LRPDSATAAAIEEGPRYLRPISGTRLWAEFELVAAERRVLPALRLLDRWGVLGGVHEALGLAPDAAGALRHRPGPHEVATLAALLLAPLDRGAEVLDRFSAPLAVRSAVGDTATLLAAGNRQADPVTLDRLSDTAGAARLAAAWLAPDAQRRLQRSVRRWERTRPHLNGRALMRLGLPEGPAVGHALDRLRRERYVGNLSSAAEARRAVRAWLAEGSEGAAG